MKFRFTTLLAWCRSSPTHSFGSEKISSTARSSSFLQNVAKTQKENIRSSLCMSMNCDDEITTAQDDNNAKCRRRALLNSTLLSSLLFVTTISSSSSSLGSSPASFAEETTTSKETLNFRSNNEEEDWMGTALPLLTPTQAASSTKSIFSMAKWPDPILRHEAKPIPSSLFKTPQLYSLACALRNTARFYEAVGLAAQQCGIDGSLIYLEENDLFLVNPRIVRRSPEMNMKVWTEHCLVLPPSFTATVLRDAIVTIQYESIHTGSTMEITLHGELARAAQHEMDHDDGILLLDHIDLNDIDDDTMRQIEFDGHEARMARAYSRSLSSSRLSK